MEHATGFVEIRQHFHCLGMESPTIHQFTAEPVDVADNNGYADCAEKIHNLRQRSEVVFLLRHCFFEIEGL